MGDRLLRVGFGGLALVSGLLERGVKLLLHSSFGLFALTDLFGLGGTGGRAGDTRLGQPAARQSPED